MTKAELALALALAQILFPLWHLLPTHCCFWNVNDTFIVSNIQFCGIYPSINLESSSLFSLGAVRVWQTPEGIPVLTNRVEDVKLSDHQQNSKIYFFNNSHPSSSSVDRFGVTGRSWSLS